jgi:transcriptional regulator of aromatic amino acid metabolism
MNLSEIAVLKEGYLRRHRKKGWCIQTEQGLVLLDDVLARFKDKDVRITCASLTELEELVEAQQAADVDDSE